MGLHLLKEEILAAIGEMKNNKAEGIDNIPTEIIKNLGEKAMKELVQLCTHIQHGIMARGFLTDHYGSYRYKE